MDEMIDVLLLLYFGGSAIWYGINYTPVMGTCLKYDLVRSGIANRGLFSYDQVQNGAVRHYQNWGIRYGFGLKAGAPYKLLVNKKNPHKIGGYNIFVFHCVLSVLTLLNLVLYMLYAL